MPHTEGHVEDESYTPPTTTTTTTTIPPTTTQGRLKSMDEMGFSGGGTGNLLGDYKRIYLEQSGPLAGLTRIINALLDNGVFLLDVQQPEFSASADATTQRQGVFGFGADSPSGYTLMDLRNPENVTRVAQALANTELNKPWGDLTPEQKQLYTAQAEAEAKRNRYVYSMPAQSYDVPLKDDEAGQVLVSSSFDGTPMGDISTVEEALLGMDLHKSAIEGHMPMVASMSPDKFRAIQSELMVLGFYDDVLAGGWQPTWGIAQQQDTTAWWRFINDMMSINLRQGELHRQMGKKPENYEAMQFSDYIDLKFSDRLERWKQNLLTPTIDVTEGEASYTQLIDAVDKAVAGKIKPEAATKVREQIDQTVSNLIASGEIDFSEGMTHDVLGYSLSNHDVATADAFLHEYFGDDIKLGVTGSAAENRRYRKSLGLRAPDDAYNPMHGEPDPTDLKDQARLAFHMIHMNSGRGDMNLTANIFANTYGAKRFSELNNDPRLLEGMVAKMDAMPFHPAYQASKAVSNQERLEALDTMEKRALAALDISEFEDDDNDQRQRVLIDVLNNLGGGKFTGSLYR